MSVGTYCGWRWESNGVKYATRITTWAPLLMQRDYSHAIHTKYITQIQIHIEKEIHKNVTQILIHIEREIQKNITHIRKHPGWMSIEHPYQDMYIVQY